VLVVCWFESVLALARHSRTTTETGKLISCFKKTSLTTHPFLHFLARYIIKPLGSPQTALIPRVGQWSHKSEKFSAHWTFQPDFRLLWDSYPISGKRRAPYPMWPPRPLTLSHNSARSLQFRPTDSRELAVFSILLISLAEQQEKILPSLYKQKSLLHVFFLREKNYGMIIDVNVLYTFSIYLICGFFGFFLKLSKRKEFCHNNRHKCILYTLFAKYVLLFCCCFLKLCFFFPTIHYLYQICVVVLVLFF
jgi:hypothetical protein